MNRKGFHQTAAFAAAVLLLLSPVPSRGESLTLRDALEIALSGNPDLQIASVNRESAQVEVSRQKAGFLPTISAGLSGTEYLGSGEEDEGYRTANAGVTARYNLYSGGADSASLAGAEREFSASGLDFEQERQKLFLDVTAAYLDVLSGSEILAVREEDVAGARTQLERVEALYKAGSRPVTDLYQQQSSVKEAELALISAQRDLQASRLQLLLELGLEKDPDFDVSDPVLQERVAEVQMDLEGMIEAALENRRDIAAQRERIEAARSRISQARSGSSLTVDLSGSLTAGYNSLREGTFPEQMGADDVTASVGIDLTFPLFDARQTSHAVRQAELALVSEQVAYNRLCQQVRKELGQALEDYRMAVKSLEVSEARLLWAEKALESVSARYEAGAATLVELNDARSEASQARYDVVKSRHDRLMRVFDVFYYQGKIEAAMDNVLGGGIRS
ncbi:MAG: TolC family protein [Proteobacteria bacterium]|nr:TolC family protein [Pseudomonadota bacterium]